MIQDGDSSDPGWKKVGSGTNIPDPQHWFDDGRTLISKLTTYRTDPEQQHNYGTNRK